MQFTYHINSGEENLKIDGDLHKYLFKVRRHDKDKNLFFRNLNDDKLYEYKVITSSRRDTILQLVSSKIKTIVPLKDLHIAWCIIDHKNIEKMLAPLNEIGVSKITFIRCDYSQNNIKINYEKLNKLLINSSSQCGRSNIIKLDECDSLDKFLLNNKDTYMFNFSSNNIKVKKEDIKTIVLGCEGGFSSNEIDKFPKEKIVGIDSSMILRSETAIVSIASLVLL